MNTRKYMFKNSLVACFACCCISFASAGNPPFFPTDVVANAKGELLMTDKGVKRVDVFSPDGKTLLRSFPMDEAPTGILLDGDKAYVTTFGTTGHLQILSLESGRVEASIPTGSGACHPMFGPDKKHIYVCNQFQTTISEIDPVARKVMRTVKVLPIRTRPCWKWQRSIACRWASGCGISGCRGCSRPSAKAALPPWACAGKAAFRRKSSVCRTTAWAMRFTALRLPFPRRKCSPGRW